MFPELCESEQEHEALFLRDRRTLSGVDWGMPQGLSMESLERDPFLKINGSPIAKERLRSSKYAEKWTYPYAYVYFKKSLFGGYKVAHVEFREDEIRKLKGPVKINIGAVYK